MRRFASLFFLHVKEKDFPPHFPKFHLLWNMSHFPNLFPQVLQKWVTSLQPEQLQKGIVHQKGNSWKKNIARHDTQTQVPQA